MRIDGSTQQVGIGTATPNQLLTVKGSISASGAIQGQLDINAQSNYYYTLVIGDKGKLITFATTGSAGTLTIPPNSSVAFPIGTEITITQLGTDQWTIAGGSGVTVSAADAELKTAWVKAEVKLGVVQEIGRLEATVTQRRIREMTTDAGAKWVDDIEALIEIERAKI